MAKIVAINGGELKIGDDSGNVTTVPVSCAQYVNPSVGDVVELYRDGESFIVTKKSGDDSTQSNSLGSGKVSNVWDGFVVAMRKGFKGFGHGRATRMEYWGFFLFNVIFSTACSILVLLTKIQPLQVFYSLAMLLPGLSVAFRRMHDVSKPAGFIFIPVYGFILLFLDSATGENKYGENLKGN